MYSSFPRIDRYADIHGRGVMSGIIGADNQFGRDFNSPDANMQGLIVSIYDVGDLLPGLDSIKSWMLTSNRLAVQ